MAAYTALLLLIFRSPLFAFLDKAEKGRDAHLDGLRFFLAIAVVYHHSVFMFRYWNQLGWNDDGYATCEKMGRYAVAGFFMLSAYLFADRRFRTPRSYAVFFAKRCLRILPLAYFTSAICVALALYLNYRVGPEHTPGNPRFWRDLLIAPFLPYVGTFLSASVFNMGVMWTLTYEWGLYLSLPFILWLKRRFGPLIVLMIATLSLAWLSQDYLHAGAKLVVCFPIGFIARELRGRFSISELIGGTTVLIVIWAVFHSSSAAYNLENLILIGIPFILIANGTTIFGLLESRAAVRLGEASFSIYLLHGIFLFFLNKWITPQQVSHLHYQPFLFLTFVAICAASTITFRFIEAPFLGIARRLKST